MLHDAPLVINVGLAGYACCCADNAETVRPVADTVRTHEHLA